MNDHSVCSDSRHVGQENFCPYCGRLAGAIPLRIREDRLPVSLHDFTFDTTQWITLRLDQTKSVKGFLNPKKFLDKDGKLKLTGDMIVRSVNGEKTYEIDNEFSDEVDLTVPAEVCTKDHPFAVILVRLMLGSSTVVHPVYIQAVAPPCTSSDPRFRVERPTSQGFSKDDISSLTKKADDIGEATTRLPTAVLTVYDGFDEPIKLEVGPHAWLGGGPTRADIWFEDSDDPIRCEIVRRSPKNGGETIVFEVPVTSLRSRMQGQSSGEARLLLRSQDVVCGWLPLCVETQLQPMLEIFDRTTARFTFGEESPTEDSTSLKVKTWNWPDGMGIRAKLILLDERRDDARSMACGLLKKDDGDDAVSLKLEWPIPTDTLLLKSVTVEFGLEPLRQASGAPVSPPPFLRAGSASLSIRMEPRADVAVLGLDFGTSNSAAASRKDLGGIQTVLDRNRPFTPTCIRYELSHEEDENGVPIVRPNLTNTIIGAEARVFTGDPLFQGGVKALLLDASRREKVEEESVHFTDNFRPTVDNLVEDFLYLYLRRILRKSDAVGGRALQQLVYTYPVTAPRAYRVRLEKTLIAVLERLHVTGVQVHEGCDEATAGGLWWFQTNSALFPKDVPSRVMVFDYGGGTTDISLLEFFRKDGVWTITVLGVAGVAYCGGDDLSWRMGRAFAEALIKPREKLASELRITRTGLPPARRRKWQKEFPEIIKEIDFVKPEMVGAGYESSLVLNREKVQKAINGESGLISVKTESSMLGIELPGDTGRSKDGYYGYARFPDWDKPGVSRRSPGRNAKDSLLEGDAWIVDVPKLLVEPRSAMQIARNLAKMCLNGARLDYLLVTGQASQTLAFQNMLDEELHGLCERDHVVKLSKNEAKSCVAMGVCVFSSSRNSVHIVPTIRKRIVYKPPQDLGQQERWVEILPSYTRYNDVQTFDASQEGQSERWATLSSPSQSLGNDRRGDARIYIDMGYSDEFVPVTSIEGESLQAPARRICTGFQKPASRVCVAAIDLGDQGTFTVIQGANALQDLIEKAKSQASWAQQADWYFAVWPEGNPEEAWIYMVSM